MASTKEKLLSLHNNKEERTTNKVSVVGVGQVGMACAFSMLTQVNNKSFLIKLKEKSY
jgi:hypothetical protein